MMIKTRSTEETHAIGICEYCNEYKTSTINMAVANNRPAEVLASVISFTSVVYSHHKHSSEENSTMDQLPQSKGFYGHCLSHKSFL